MKRRSGSRRGNRPPEDPVFFVDECLGKQVAQALLDAGARVEVHAAHFPKGVDDVDWIPEVSRRGWVILSKDKMVRTRPNEKSVLLSSNARAFILTSGNMTGPTMAETFVKQLRKMVRLARQQQPPFIAMVKQSGVSLYLST